MKQIIKARFFLFKKMCAAFPQRKVHKAVYRAKEIQRSILHGGCPALDGCEQLQRSHFVQFQGNSLQLFPIKMALEARGLAVPHFSHIWVFYPLTGWHGSQSTVPRLKFVGLSAVLKCRCDISESHKTGVGFLSSSLCSQKYFRKKEID